MIDLTRRHLLKLLSSMPLLVAPNVIYAKERKAAIAPLVMLDPGHGGKDPGAIGPKGTKEKDVVLDIAKRTQSYLKKSHHINALLTRKNDTFVDLRKRVQLAHKHNCTLFVSIHADGFTEPSVCGASVFSLSLNGALTTLEKYIEKTENGSNNDYSELIFSKNKDLNKILLDMNQQFTLRRNLNFSKCMIQSIGKNHIMHNHYCNSANFVVLRSPIIPSILVETAFITNADDEKKLNNKEYRSQIARSISNGISSFIHSEI